MAETRPPASMHGPYTPELRQAVMAYCNDKENIGECKECKPQNFDCDTLVKRINGLVRGGNGIHRGLEGRWNDQQMALTHNKRGVFYGLCPPGTMRYTSHTMEYLKQQGQLRQRLKELDEKQPPCPNKDEVDREAREWAEKKVPDSGTHSNMEVIPENNWGDRLMPLLMRRMNPALQFIPPGLLQQLMRPATIGGELIA